MTITKAYSGSVATTVALPISVAYSGSVPTTIEVKYGKGYSGSTKTTMSQVGAVTYTPTRPDDPGAANYTFGSLDLNTYLVNSVNRVFGIIDSGQESGRSIRRVATLETYGVTVEFFNLLEDELELIENVLGTVFTFEFPDGGDMLAVVADDAIEVTKNNLFYDVSLRIVQFN